MLRTRVTGAPWRPKLRYATLKLTELRKKVEDTAASITSVDVLVMVPFQFAGDKKAQPRREERGEERLQREEVRKKRREKHVFVRRE